MPYIFDGNSKRFIAYDVDRLAKAVEEGYQIGPDRYDYETDDQFKQRAQREYEAVSKTLKQKNPKAWRKWHGIPEPENIAPLNEWDKLPMRNPGSLANASDSISLADAGGSISEKMYGLG